MEGSEKFQHIPLNLIFLVCTEAVIYTCYVSESNSRKDGVEVPDLLRYLSRNLIGPHWLLIRPFTISKVGPSEDEGE